MRRDEAKVSRIRTFFFMSTVFSDIETFLSHPLGPYFLRHFLTTEYNKEKKKKLYILK